jgi:hypothetical protein
MSDTNDSTTVLQFQWKEGRNYSSHAITAAESTYLDHQKKPLSSKYSSITTAICYRTLVGNDTIPKIFSWVCYYRLLGFDHVFFWYRRDMAQRPYSDEVKAFPYVTLMEYTGSAHRTHGQVEAEHACLSQTKFAANYSWALPVDLDECLWHTNNEPIYKYVVNRLDDFHYVWLGKYMYTRRHAVALERNDSGFCLDRYMLSRGVPFVTVNAPRTMFARIGWAGPRFWSSRLITIKYPRLSKSVPPSRRHTPSSRGGAPERISEIFGHCQYDCPSGSDTLLRESS